MVGVDETPVNILPGTQLKWGEAAELVLKQELP